MPQVRLINQKTKVELHLDLFDGNIVISDNSHEEMFSISTAELISEDWIPVICEKTGSSAVPTPEP